ncbi:MAG: hypothetical protein MK329_12270 [Pirellulales bacterium]|jgi:hypothetical protein|nr:hypothetical protein [Pirellulales bacterium]
MHRKSHGVIVRNMPGGSTIYRYNVRQANCTSDYWAFEKMDWFILAESFLETPTALGVPMGTLLLFWILMRRLDDIEKNKKE